MTKKQLYLIAFLCCSASLNTAQASVGINSYINASSFNVAEINTGEINEAMRGQLVAMASRMNEGEWY